MDKVNILEVDFSNITLDEAADKMLSFLKDGKKHMIFTPNSEILYDAYKDSEFKKILNSADMNVPDGIGVVYASAINGKKLKQRVAGYDLCLNLFEKLKNGDKTIYFFGGAPKVAENAKEKIEKKYKIKIIGTSDGYFDDKKEKLIIDEINKLSPDILLVGLGAPKQEKWIYKNINNLNAKIFMGVGGSFDGFSGAVKRAPDIFIKLGLEWLYRLIKQPSRFVRMLKLPLFMLLVIKHKIKGR